MKRKNATDEKLRLLLLLHHRRRFFFYWRVQMKRREWINKISWYFCYLDVPICIESSHIIWIKTEYEIERDELDGKWVHTVVWIAFESIVPSNSDGDVVSHSTNKMWVYSIHVMWYGVSLILRPILEICFLSVLLYLTMMIDTVHNTSSIQCESNSFNEVKVLFNSRILVI